MADVTVNISADISKFEQQMDEITTKYQQTKNNIEEKGIETAPLSSFETRNDTRKSYGYMFQSFDEMRNAISDVSSLGTDLPGEMVQAISTLTNGMKASLTSLKSSLKVAGQAIQDSFDPNSFNNGVRYQATSLKQYAKDMREASILANQMTAETRNALGSNTKQLLSLVAPAITQISAKERKTLSDVALRGRMQSDEYGYISKFLNSIGINDRAEQQKALDFAIKTSSARISRADAADAFNYARMRGNQLNVAVTDQFRDSYKTPFLHGGRFVSDAVTPLSTARSNREATSSYYKAIQQEILHGNNLAFKAAQEAGLVSVDRGQFSFAKEGTVLKNKDMLNHFSGLVVQEAKRASQGSPQFFRNVNNPYEEEAILDKDNIALREARRLIGYDARPDAKPYLIPNYRKPKAAYEGVVHNTPELKIGESINIPRMTVQDVNGQTQFMVREVKDGKVNYRPNIDFNWKKENGVVENNDDEFITMGRNPILDRLMRLHPETKFENRGFGYGFDAKDKAVSGKPLIIDMPIDSFYKKDAFKQIMFEDSETGRTAKFEGNGEELIRKLYSGELKPVLQFGDEKPTAYRAFAGKLDSGGSMKFMQNADYNELMRQDRERGMIPMLDFFSETDKNGKLINPKTGKVYEERETDSYKAYAKFFDARNKILSHSIPIEEMGGKTPLAALVNFEAFYDAAKISKDSGIRFDGGAFIDPSVYNTDFQARMGPAKFLAQRFNWRDWFTDSGLTYMGTDGKQHMYMPGMSAKAEDYTKFKEDQKRYLAGEMSQKDIQTFEKWRDERFVDVMDEKYGMLMADSALKSTNKLGFVTPEKYAEITSIRGEAVKNGVIQSTAFTEQQKRAAEKSGMIPLTPAQQTELMAIMSDKESGISLHMMKDSENYYGEKDYWSPAYMSSVQMTPAMMRRSTENYKKAFEELSTPEGIIKRMFSGLDMDSYRVQMDPRLIYTDKDIRSKVQRQISDLETKQIEGYGYFPGMAQMLLAGVNPASVFGRYATDLMSGEIQGDAAELLTKEHGIIAPMVSNQGITSWTRSPYAPGANFFAKSITSKVANKYGLSDNIALFNPEDFYQLNTGDFDGDFVWAYQALKDDKDFVRMTEERNKAVNELMKKRQEDANRRKDLDGTEQAVQYQHDASDFAQAVLRTTNTINPIGIGYKLGQAGRVMKLTPEQLQVIDAYANEVYGAAIDQKKDPSKQIREATGVLVEARNSRQPFDRLGKAIMEEAGKDDYGGTDIFKYALPTYLDPMGVSVLSGALAGRNNKVDYGSNYASAIRKNIEARYQGRTNEENDLAKWYGDILIGKLTGEYQITTQDQLQEGHKKVEALRAKARTFKENSDEYNDLMAMASRAESAIKTEEAMGFTEGQLGNIESYYAFNRWRNPLNDGFRNKAQGRSAVLFQEEARRAEEAAILAQQQQAVEQVASTLSGNNLTAADRDNIYERILTANRFTGFNYSNAKYWTEGNKVLKGAVYSEASGLNPKNPVDIVSAYQKENEEYNSRRNIARQILTGETQTNADTIIGTAAHEFMDKYGTYRSKQGGTREEARAEALKAFENVLFGDEYAKDREIAGVTFENDPFYGKDKQSGSYIAKMANADKASKINNTKLKNVIKTLNSVAEEYYDTTLERSGLDHMIMTEGTMFDDEGNQVRSRRTEGGNGIWIEPMRDGQRVLPFTRYAKGSDGRLTERNAGFYFTPDMIKKNDKGEITIADWKSSGQGQQDALFQTAFYAHQLEELGKKYWTTENANEKKDLEWFGQFVTQQKDGSFTSNIKWLQALNVFGKKGEKLLTQDYTMDMGDDISKWMEQGMVSLAKSASTGFFEEHPEAIVPILSRNIKKGRSTIAPDQKEEDFAVLDDETKATINAEMERVNNIHRGGTGVRDNTGNLIDTDKSFLVAKFMKDQEQLDEISSFSNKEQRRLFNTGVFTQDEYTQRINQLKTLFDNDQYQAIQKYLGADAVAPDMALLEQGFDANQVKAVKETNNLMQLREEYVKQLPYTLKTDYDAIRFNGKDMASQLIAANYKRKRDISALQGSYEKNPYYDYDKKAFKLTEDQYYIHPGEKKEGETEEEYQKRLDQAQQDAKDHVTAAKEEMGKYNTQMGMIEAAYEEFSGNWVERLSQAKETEGNVLLSAFSTGSIDKAAFDLKQDAKKYEQLAMKGSGEGENRVFEYSAEERAALVAEQQRKEQQAHLIESLNGTSLESLFNYQKDYDQAKINALRNGEGISPEILRQKAMGDFALEYIKAFENASPEDVQKAIEDYGALYDKRLEVNNTQRLSDVAFQTDIAARQREFQYDRYNRTRYGNRGRIAQYYYQQKDRQFELEKERDTNIHAAERAERRLSIETDPQKIAALKAQMQGYKQAAADASRELERFNPVQNVFAAGIKSVGDSLNMVVRRLGMQMFRKALNEAKTFVKEFDKQMTTIQMITLKSDTEMSKVGDGLISKAKELKISVSEISQSAATLYRQGLSDEEVNERLDVISKFSKVSGTKVDAATKLITVAMNTGLVTSPEEASDIVTALGDNAATNAAQIEKGIEKAGAAAAADGTTFGQLAAMLTAITSTTQIGGNVAGRTLNTIFGRMNKIGTNELIYDENGHAISGSAVSKLLKAQGIETYQDGKKRSSYDVLYELSQKWEGISDAEQQQLASAIAGTRQYSNFSAIMQGMSEGKVDEYMELIGESSGITDKKFDIYTQSLEASLTDVKNTFDELVADLVDKGYVQDFLSGITTMIQGVDKLIESFGGLSTALPTIMAILGAFSGARIGGALGALIGMGVGLAGYGILTSLGSQDTRTKQEIFTDSVDNYKTSYDNRVSEISRFRELASKDNKTSTELREYDALADKLSVYANVSGNITDAAKATSEFASAASEVAANAEEAASKSKEYAEIIAKEAQEKADKEKIQNIYSTMSQGAESIASTGNELVGEYYQEEGSYLSLKNKSEEFSKIAGYKDFEFNEENFKDLIGKASKMYSYSSNAIEEMIANDYLDSVAQYLEQISKNDPDASIKGKKASYWKEQLLNASSVSNGLWRVSDPLGIATNGKQGTISDEFITEALDYGAFRVKSSATSLDKQKEGLQSGFESILREHGIDEEYIPFIAKDAVEKYYADERTQPVNGKRPAVQSEVILDQLKRIYGYTEKEEVTPANFEKAVKQAAIQGGWTSTELQAEEHGLGIGDYYYDPVSGKYYTTEEAFKLREQELAADEDRKKQYTTQYSGGIRRTYNAIDYGSAKAAKAAAEQAAKTNLYYYTDRDGNKHFYETEEQRNEQQARYEREEALWMGGFNDETGKRVWVSGLTKSDLEKDLAEKREESIARSYRLKDELGRDIGEGFATEELAQAEADRLNALEAERYTTETIKAQTDWENAIKQTFTPELAQAIIEQRTLPTDQRQYQYAVTSGKNNLLDLFGSQEEAEAYAEQRKVRYYNPETYEEYGYGEEGYQEFLKQNEEYKASHIKYKRNGFSVSPEEAEAYKANGEIGYTVMIDGQKQWFTDYDKAKEAYEAEYKRLREAYYEEGKYDLTQSIWKEKYKPKFDELGRGPKEEEAKITETQQSMSYATEYFDAQVTNIDKLVKTMQDQIPELADVDPARALAVYSQLPTEIQTMLFNSTEIGQEALQVIEGVNKSITDTDITELREVKNHFGAGLVATTEAWKTKNNVSLAADSMLNMMLTNNFGSLQELFDYVNLNDIKAWETLNTQEEFAGLMNGVNWEGGKITSAPEGIMSNILTYLYKASSNAANRSYTNAELSSLASEALNGLQSGAYASYNLVEDEYQKQKEAFDKAFTEENGELLNYEDYIKSQGIETGDNMVYSQSLLHQYDKYVKDRERKYNQEVGEYKNVDTFIAANGIKYLSQEQKESLKSIVGDKLYNKALEGNLTKEEAAYVNSTISNRSVGLTSLTTKQQLEGIKDFRAQIKAGRKVGEGQEDYQTEIATKYLSGWSGANEYLALLAAQGTEEFDKLGGQKRLDVLGKSLDNFQKQTQFKFEIEGIQQLEEAGELAEGTFTAIEKLRKGGKVAIEVTTELQNKAYSAGQTRANLVNGTVQQQDEAIMSILGISKDQLYSNRDYYVNRATDVEALSREQQIASLWEEYRHVGPTQRSAIREAAKQLGYKINLSGYEDTGVPEIDQTGYFEGEAKKYTDMELANARARILNGTLSKESQGEENALYKAAAASMGKYSAEYQRQVEAGQTPTEQLHQLALAEEAEAMKSVQEALDLENAKYGATSIGGALSYANLRYQQNNKGAIAANTIFESLSSQNIQSVADLSEAVNKSDVENWKDLLESSEEVRKAFDDMGAKVSDDGKSIDFSGVTSSADGLTSAFNALIQAVAGASSEYNKQQEVLSTGETYNLATSYLAGTIATADEEKGYSALAEVTGNSELAQIVRNNYTDWEANKKAYEDNFYAEYNALPNDYAKASFRALHGSTPVYTEEFDPYKNLTPYNAEYARTLFENAGHGISGLTDLQRYEGLQNLIAAASTGSAENGIGALRQQDKINAFADYTSGIEGADEWLSASEQLEKYGLTMAQLQGLDENSEEYKNAEQAIKGIYTSVEQAIEANDEFEDSVAQVGQQLKTNGKYIDEYNIGLKKNSKNTKEAASATANYNKTMSDVMSRQYARRQFKQNGKVTDELAGMFGVTKKEIEENKEKYLDQLSIFEDSDEELIASMIQGQFDSVMNLVQADLQSKGLDLGEFQVETNGEVSLDMSRLQGQLSGEAAAALASIAAELAGQGVTWHAEPFGDGENGGVRIVVDSLGSGRKGGGGGGGGKSELDRMLERHKHEIGRIEHKSKMLEIEEKGYEFTNDYASQRENIQQQVGVQEELRSAYTKNIAEMNTQLMKVQEGTDDWWKLTEAIQAAEESLASINNTIHDLNAKNLDILSRQQENEDKPINHRVSMLQKYAEKFQTQDNFESYKKAMQEVIQKTKDQIDQNEEQIKAWEKELLRFEEGSQSWLEVRDKIWAMREENADLENQVLSNDRDLKEAQIAQIANDLQNDTSSFAHANSMLDTFSQMYQDTGNFDKYRETLVDSISNIVEIRELRQKAIEELKKQIEEMAENDPARQQAIQTLYDMEEQDAQDQASLLAQRKALEESYLTQIEQEFSDREDVNSHEKNLLQEAEKSALRDKNYTQYRHLLEEQARNAGEKKEIAEDKLSSLLELESNGSITEGSEEWRRLQETIRSVTEEIASATNEQQEFNDKVKEAKFEELQDNFNDVYSLEQHQQKLIQYRQTQYQNNGELTNYGTALEWEQDALEDQKETLESYIEELKKQQEEAKDQPKLYERITTELYKQEEALAQVNNALEKNTQAQKKNEEAIRKAQIAVEQQADKAIRERVQNEKDMLSATVSIENSILAVIKKNYQDQWDLEKKTLEKKKQALQEEKNLINDRLNQRKNALDEEHKYEELAEYQHQLALISTDTTRTKEQAELRRKIAELQEELAMDVATQEANAQIKSIDDQMKAQDDYVAAYQEDLNEMLSNSNNFREDLDTLLNGSFEDFMAWNAKYNEDYNKKTDEERQQMEESWHTTWRTMKNELLTYWEEVDKAIGSKEDWLDLVTSQNSYKKLSDTEKESYLYQMSELYDNYEKSLLDNAEFEDNHEILNKISELKEWTFKVTDVGKEDYQFDTSISDFEYNRKKAEEDLKEDSDYHGVGYVKEAEEQQQQTVSTGSGKQSTGKVYEVYDDKGFKTNYTVTANSKEEAYKLAQEQYGSHYAAGQASAEDKAKQQKHGYTITINGKDYSRDGFNLKSDAATAAYQRLTSLKAQVKSSLEGTVPIQDINKMLDSASIKIYKRGGIVDYTGPAWVDGTKTKPEAFLNADDTALLRGMLDAFSNVKTPYITHVDDSNFGSSGINIGDVNVNLYEAKLEKDADYDLIAQKVGKAFTKQLQKDGLNLVNYAW